MIKLILFREFKIAFRKRADFIHPLGFFVIVITLFSIGIGADSALLSNIASSVVWVAVLLSSLLSLERLFRDDFIDGTLEQLMLLPIPLSLIVFAKVCAHWLFIIIPFLILSPIIAVLLSFSFAAWNIMVLTLILGTPALSFIGAIGVALTVGLRKGGTLLSLLVLPLYVPILIFATSAIEMATMGVDISGVFALLAAISVGSATLAPFAISSALRITMN